MAQTNPVREARIRRLLKVKDLAELAGVSRDVVFDAEHGTPIGDLSKERIARALELEREDLFPQEASA